MKNKLYILSFAVVLTGIGVLSLMPPSSGIELGEHDKWNHFIAYLVLSLNWCMIENKSKVFFLGLLFCGDCYGLSCWNTCKDLYPKCGRLPLLIISNNSIIFENVDSNGLMLSLFELTKLFANLGTLGFL